ncbi:flotillin family protein [Actomonas aquatica]|uniref:SPFH domain-containing protein n=1 Tax=Actomonas aquatica TaxID=2866162 RepID=A0ABZ1C5R0_9BACT|nr:flotillin family protein [Opitutus sp. WL0086]WRQ87072.1 SPFH domain-containing protein [Opitutus sp. WL0086]
MLNLPILLGIAAGIVFFVGFLVTAASRYKRCPSDRLLVVYGKIAGGKSANCYHGGAAFVWPVIQGYQYLDLTPMPIDIRLEGALSKQNIRVNTPSTFTVGISTEPGVMENAAERLLGLGLAEIKELAKDIIFGQMRVVIATMDIEEINADRDKLIANISMGVEVELKKVGLRLINVNVQDITDASGYIDALGQEAASKAIAEAKVKVAQAHRDGDIGAAEAQRDQRVRVAEADAVATEGENAAKVTVANSHASRRVKEAEAERMAVTSEKVAQATALKDSYVAEEAAEKQRAIKEKATQEANVIVPAEVDRDKAIVDAEARAEAVRRIQKGEADAVRLQKQAEADGLKAVKQAEADGLRFRLTAEADGQRLKMLAEAEGVEALLKNKAKGFAELVSSFSSEEQAQLMLVIEQLPRLVEEQVKAIQNLKIDKVTVWDSGKGADGKSSTTNFLSGLVGALPPLHEITRNVGVELPEYLGKLGSQPAPKAAAKPADAADESSS